MLKHFIIVYFIYALVGVSPLFANDIPIWLENDSTEAINARLKRDFSLTMTEADSALKVLYGITDEDIHNYINNHYLETKIIDGKEMMHHKSLSNLKLLCPEIRGDWDGRGSNSDEMRQSIVDSIIKISSGDGYCPAIYRVKYKFSIDVPFNEQLEGDTLRVWMPVPIESERQQNVTILSSYPKNYIVSTPNQSVHHTIYFSQPVKTGRTTHFEYEGSYDVSAKYYSPEYIEKNIKPYNTESDLYQKYTNAEFPHIKTDSIVFEIIGDETSPFLQSEKVFDYIVKNYPWAGAREYSTIECIPEYVLNEKHGDCGQVALLYISLMRTLGIPARWESGWMLHPGEKNLHDWAEVYFEGVGWVPIDVSFGRYSNAPDETITNFYSTGIDQYRFASNTGICGNLYPAKQFVRSETVDFQLGEVECSKGNLFYSGWNQHMEIISIEKIK